MFDKNTITAQGLEMIRSLLTGGKQLIFTRAVGGSDTSTEGELYALTALPSENQTLALTAVTRGQSGSVLSVRIASQGLESEYTLRQVGIYAKLDDNGTETLLQVAQDETGVRIPAQSDSAGMTLDLSIGIKADIGEAAVMIDSSAYVTTGQLYDALGDVVRTRTSVQFYIAPEEWEEIPDGDMPVNGLLWQVCLRNDRFSRNYVPYVIFDAHSILETMRYGISVKSDMLDGELYLYAEEKPEVAISGDCYMLMMDPYSLNGSVIRNGTWGNLFNA